MTRLAVRHDLRQLPAQPGVDPDQYQDGDAEQLVLEPGVRDREVHLPDQRRGVRFMLEYEKAEEHLRAWGVKSTIVVFGSARTHENGNGEHMRWYEAARKFAKIASERGGAMITGGRNRDPMPSGTPTPFPHTMRGRPDHRSASAVPVLTVGAGGRNV